jgi:SAM-dependent methyltransferase
MTSSADRDYVLGTHDAEIERLGLQHRVWRPRVLDVWRRAGLTSGHTAIDLGCGPGYATLDLAEIVGPSGHVHAIDRSGRFLAALSGEAARRGLHQITTYEQDLDDSWPPVTADLVWCRWVAAFVQRPQAFVSRLRDLLRPGGRLVMHEYLDYAAWSFLPDSGLFDHFVGTVIATWRKAGGEPDIGRDLPMWLEGAGLKIDELRPIVDVVSAADAMWPWPRAFVEVGLERLVSIGAMSRDEAAATWTDFLAREASPGTRMVNPIVLEVVATRPY